MATFDQLFPTFLLKCRELHDLLQLASYCLFIVGIISVVIHGLRKRTFFRYLVRLTLLTALLVFLPRWGNELQTLLQQTIVAGLNVDPAQVHNQYQGLLDLKKADSSGSESWISLIADFESVVLEKVLFGVLYLVGSLAAYLHWWAYVFQKVILHLGYALSPLLIGFMAIPGLQGIGSRYLMSLFGVLLWPLGWAVAALVSQGVLDFMTDPTFKFLDPTATSYQLQNMVGLGILSFWTIFSTFSGPIVIQRVFIAGTLAGTELLSQGIASLIQSATTSVAAGGAALAAGAGMARSIGAASTAGVLSAASLSAGLGNAGVFLLAGNGSPLSASRSLRAKNDLSGDLAVRELLHRSQSSYSEPKPPQPKQSS